MNDIFEKYKAGKDFTTLEAWKKVRALKLFFYKKVIPFLPEEEKFNLNVQIRKASVSGTANISEGYGRFYHQEAIQFYRISRGSIYELKDHLISCVDFEDINEEIFEEGIIFIEDAKITLNGYIKYIRDQKEKGIIKDRGILQEDAEDYGKNELEDWDQDNMAK